MSSKLVNMCKNALVTRAKDLGYEPDKDYYLNKPFENLVDQSRFESTFNYIVKPQFEKGNGGELKRNKNGRISFCAIHSSAALAVNCFIQFHKMVEEKSHLNWHDLGTMSSLQFEYKAIIEGIKGTPPNLDVVLENEKQCLFFESKLLEPLRGGSDSFSIQYQKLEKARWDDEWHKQFQKLTPSKYLNASQLVKHYLGIRSYKDKHPGKDCKLIYLYWEPKNASEFQEFRDHAKEAASFAKQVKSSKVKLSVLSYPQLWEQWLASDLPKNIKVYIEKVRERYWVDVEHPKK